ncbi:hypothetical protein [Pseudoxanthomonas koreensis]|uniref:hypothetical protein n=1 Tax=Pseudoxanthomonas koreensis TaxID=266061 RepID=UPI0035A6881E
MSLLEALALAVVVLAGMYLLALGTASLFVPARASRFLLGFASSASVHFAELFLRFAVGAALVVYAPRMSLSGVFNLFGWLLLVTTAGLLVIPWRWHHRFAQQVVPLFTRYVALIGLVSLVFGGLILWAVARGSAA